MRRLGLFVLLGLVLSSAGASAQTREDDRWSLSTGIGFTADPDAFLLGFEGDYRVYRGLSLGAELQLGLDDDFTIVSPTARARYTFDLSGVTRSEFFYRLRPYLQTGLGFTYIEADVPDFPGVDDDDTGLLVNFGFGAEYALTRSLSLNSKMLFNFLPGDVFGESFYYSWEVAGLRYRF
ncbi:MAG: outer membrane beta-barrel protein [Myxococcota bacterium]|nr:outer membrane beta-barrel protein [Myxococcota bacterium]